MCQILCTATILCTRRKHIWHTCLEVNQYVILVFYLLNLNSLLFGVFLKKCQSKIFTPGRHSELSQISKIKRFADLKTVKYFLKKLHLRSLAPCLRAFCQHIYLNWTPERMVSQELVASSLSIHKDRTVVKFSAKWQQT